MNENSTIMRAAIVDDEKDLCYLLKNILKKEAVDAVEINSLEEAKTELEGIHPRVIFLDNHLPDGTGIEFIPHIKKKLPDAKVIMMTAFNAAGEENLAMANGADYFLMKPLSRKIIQDTLSKIGLRANH